MRYMKGNLIKYFQTRLLRYKYLLRLILTIFTTLLVSVFIMTYLLTQQSYSEINTQNNEYYIEHTYNSSITYREQISRMLNVALRIGLDGKLNQDEIASSPWQRINTVKTMADYKVAVPMVDYIGITFYDLDYIFTSTSSNSVGTYVYLTADDNPELSEALRKLLSEDNGERFTVLSSFDAASESDRRIFIIIPISTEFNFTNNASVICSISEPLFSQYFMSQTGTEQYGLAIFDSQLLPFFYNSEFDSSLCVDRDFLAFLTNDTEHYYEYRTEAGQSRIFRWHDANAGLYFVSLIPEGTVMIRIRSFYNSVRLMTALMLLVLLLLTAVTVYINYKPVMSMVRRIRDMKVAVTPVDSCGELKTVEEVLFSVHKEYKEMSVAVSEQQLMLVEHMLGNILYGLPIQKEKICFLDSSLLDKSFMVISVQELRLDNSSCEQLSQTIREQLGITVYITDIQYEPIMAIICVISEATAVNSSISGEIDELLKLMYQRNFAIGTGIIVNSLNNIRKSYLESRIDLDSHTKNLNRSDASSNTHLERLMLEYVNSNFHKSDINLVQVSDLYNISVYTCSRMFKEFTGIGFKEYISAKRMELAKELLLSTNKNVYEIAAETGFENSTYFMTWFKGNCGMTPTHFRKHNPVRDSYG